MHVTPRAVEDHLWNELDIRFVMDDIVHPTHLQNCKSASIYSYLKLLVAVQQSPYCLFGATKVCQLCVKLYELILFCLQTDNILI